MSEYSQGGWIPGPPTRIQASPDRRPNSPSPADVHTIYADECFISPSANTCVRRDLLHRPDGTPCPWTMTDLIALDTLERPGE